MTYSIKINLQPLIIIIGIHLLYLTCSCYQNSLIIFVVGSIVAREVVSLQVFSFHCLHLIRNEENTSLVVLAILENFYQMTMGVGTNI